MIRTAVAARRASLFYVTHFHLRLKIQRGNIVSNTSSTSSSTRAVCKRAQASKQASKRAQASKRTSKQTGKQTKKTIEVRNNQHFQHVPVSSIGRAAAAQQCKKAKSCMQLYIVNLHDKHDKLVHSFQSRQIYPLKGFIVSMHRLSCPPPSLAPSWSNPGPHALKNSALPSPVIRLTRFTW